jgi:hypothetical protein
MLLFSGHLLRKSSTVLSILNPKGSESGQCESHRKLNQAQPTGRQKQAEEHQHKATEP